jgi:hypothetical protein
MKIEIKEIEKLTVDKDDILVITCDEKTLVGNLESIDKMKLKEMLGVKDILIKTDSVKIHKLSKGSI